VAEGAAGVAGWALELPEQAASATLATKANADLRADQ
jgi:hypothetical protein